ncbi:hypothetical protein PTKIN_Ptkin01aG0392600 [Pterospermum kingtungense]
MATRQISLTIFLLFLSLLLLLLLPVSNGAIYRTHDLRSPRNKQTTMTHFSKVSSCVLTKGVPIPPSGPSKRHNDQPDVDVPRGSASDRDGLGV